MFYARQDTKATEPDSFAVRVKTVSASAAQTAAQGVSSAAQSAATGVSKGVQQGVYTVRVWTAPRLETAADHTTATVAPKVSSALRTYAQQIRPEDVSQKKSHSVLMWSLLAAGVVATAGAVAALVRYRYRAAMTTDDEADFAAGGAPATGTEGEAPAGTSQGSPAEAGADAGVNGRVSTSGW
jgi:hypothetical protein